MPSSKGRGASRRRKRRPRKRPRAPRTRPPGPGRGGRGGGGRGPPPGDRGGDAGAGRGRRVRRPIGMASSAEMVRELRDRTGAGVMDCKAALEAAGGGGEGGERDCGQEG